MNIKKTLQASAVSFLVLNLVKKAVLHYAGLYKSALRNNQLITSNADNLKTVETLKTSAFNFIIIILVNINIWLYDISNLQLLSLIATVAQRFS